jgi:CheY-like chemotaxis protein
LAPSIPVQVLLVEDNHVNIKVSCLTIAANTRASASGDLSPYAFIEIAILMCSRMQMMSMLLTRLGWPQAPGDIVQDAAVLTSLASTPYMPSHRVAQNGLLCLELLEKVLTLVEAHQAAGGSALSVSEAGRRLVPLLILMDVSMDVMDGLECCTRIRRDLDSRYLALGLPPPCVLPCTANVSHDNIVSCQKAGMSSDFIAKPLSFDVLVRALRRAGASIQAATRATANSFQF